MPPPPTGTKVKMWYINVGHPVLGSNCHDARDGMKARWTGSVKSISLFPFFRCFAAIFYVE